MAFPDIFDLQDKPLAARGQVVRNDQVNRLARTFMKTVRHSHATGDDCTILGHDFPRKRICDVRFGNADKIVAGANTGLRRTNLAAWCVEGFEIFLLARLPNWCRSLAGCA